MSIISFYTFNYVTGKKELRTIKYTAPKYKIKDGIILNSKTGEYIKLSDRSIVPEKEAVEDLTIITKE